MTTTRMISRTLAGLLVPTVAGAVAAGFVFLTILHAHDATWLGVDKAVRLFIAGMGILLAVGIEMFVLRQKKLIGNGQIVEAIVDEVREISWSKEHSAAYYHFFTEDRRVITSCCAIGKDKKDSWSPGQKIMAIYDPARPARHVVNDSLWAVRSKAA
jgi:hypothetical protein